MLRAPTAQGLVYYKQTPPFLGHEIALTAMLSRWHPGSVPDVLATDTAEHRLLMADGGVPIRDTVKATRDYTVWFRPLRNTRSCKWN